MDLSPYHYRSLSRSRDQIRLLQLDIQGDREPLCGKITHHYISDLVPYVALSYVWNDPQPSETILINDNEVAFPCKITRSLYDAL